jgi:glycosyltransferase involved in cell wall biosynthesis
LKIVHVIGGLGVGGAERGLAKLNCGLDAQKYDINVVSLSRQGEIGAELESKRINVFYLNMNWGPSSVLAFSKLVSLLKRIEPDVIHCWMYHGYAVGALAAHCAGIKRQIIWSIHHTDVDPARMKKRTLWIIRLCRFLSEHFAPAMVFCAKRSLESHMAIGFRCAVNSIIPNGFDTNLFKPNESARKSVRAELGILENQMVIGTISRFNPQKAPFNFVDAANKLSNLNNDAKYIMCGSGLEWSNSELTERIDLYGLRSKFHLLGVRHNMEEIISAFDVGVSASISEAFPNCIAEMMSCEIPCVVSDAGDSSLIVDKYGVVVPPDNVAALAKGISEIIESDALARRRLGYGARTRIVDAFGLDKYLARYRELYSNVSRTSYKMPA